MKKISLFITLLLVAIVSYAVPARPGWQTKTQPDGTTIELRLTGDEFYHYWQDRSGNVVKCDSLGYWRVVESQPTPATIKARRQASRMLQSRPNKAVGSVNLAPRGLVILVNFADVAYQTANTQAGMFDMLNSDNYTYNGATGSVRQFFSDQSDGQYTPDFDVIGPVTLTETVAHYGANDASGNDVLPGDMVVEACSIANANYGVDFTQYDNDDDGYVDFVYIVYAGKGEADGGAENTIWPHNWDLASAYYYDNCSYSTSQRKFDGKTINNYACSAELNIEGHRDGIGTIAHEFSHVIGLPDLYDIDYGQNYEDEMTPGEWHIMDAGSYNNDGKTPPNYTIYDKYYLGWKTPGVLTGTQENMKLIANGREGYEGYQLSSKGTLLSATNTNIVYYIENRQLSGWDEYLPGHGLIIWKVTYDKNAWTANGPNDKDGVLRYTLISAAGWTDGIGTEHDPFPGVWTKTRVWSDNVEHTIKSIIENDEIIILTYTNQAENIDPNEIIEIKARVPETWTNDITLWVWTTDVDGQMVEAIKEGDWYVYIYYGNKLNAIFRNGMDWGENADQTIDMQFTESACIEIISMGEGLKANYQHVNCAYIPPVEPIVIKAKVPATWTNDITLWVWPTGGDGKVVVPEKVGDWYVYTHEGTEVNIIFRNGTDWNGDKNQTIDMLFTESACIEIVSDGVNKAEYTNVDCDDQTTTTIENTHTDSTSNIQKIIRDSRLLIIRCGEIYDVFGNKL